MEVCRGVARVRTSEAVEWEVGKGDVIGTLGDDVFVDTIHDD